MSNIVGKHVDLDIMFEVVGNGEIVSTFHTEAEAVAEAHRMNVSSGWTTEGGSIIAIWSVQYPEDWDDNADFYRANGIRSN